MAKRKKQSKQKSTDKETENPNEESVDMGAPNPLRQSGMEAIVAKRRAQLGIEEPEKPNDEADAQPDDENETPTEPEGETIKEPEGEIEEPEEPEGDDDAVKEPESEPPVYWKDGRWMTKAKIDGETVEIAMDEAINRYQKHEVAEQRLRDAAQWQRELEQREAKLRDVHDPSALSDEDAQRGSAQSRSEASPSVKADVIAKIQPVTRQFLDALYSGDEEAAESAFSEVVNRISGEITQEGRADSAQQISEDEINQRVKEAMATAKWQSDLEEARNWFKEEYKDVYEDPDLYAVADWQTGLIHDQGDFDSPRDILKRAGDYARKLATKKGGPAKAGDMSDRKEAKRNTPRTVEPATHRAPGPGSERPRTPEEGRRAGIDQIRRFRNQQSV